MGVACGGMSEEAPAPTPTAPAVPRPDPNWDQLERVSINDHDDESESEDEEICFYDEVEIDEMDFDEAEGVYTMMCPCGDLFAITEEELAMGQQAAYCLSCTLVLKVLYDQADFEFEQEEVPIAAAPPVADETAS